MGRRWLHTSAATQDEVDGKSDEVIRRTWLQSLEEWSKVAACITGVCMALTFHQIISKMFDSNWLASLSMIGCAVFVYYYAESDEEQEERELIEQEELMKLIHNREKNAKQIRRFVEASGDLTGYADDSEENPSAPRRDSALEADMAKLREAAACGLDEDDMTLLREECERLEKELAEDDRPDGPDMFSAPTDAMRAKILQMLRQEADDVDGQESHEAADDTDAADTTADTAARTETEDDSSTLRRRRLVPPASVSGVCEEADAREA